MQIRNCTKVWFGSELGEKLLEKRKIMLKDRAMEVGRKNPESLTRQQQLPVYLGLQQDVVNFLDKAPKPFDPTDIGAATAFQIAYSRLTKIAEGDDKTTCEKLTNDLETAIYENCHQIIN